jgi:hypothetical protein
MDEKAMVKAFYNDSSFALRGGKSLIEENITQDRVFELIASFYTPEDQDFTIEFWDVSAKPPQWVAVVS